MNAWQFTGNLGKDCEVKYTAGGTAVCGFPVAVKSGYGDNEKTTWVTCTLFGKRAEGKLPQYLTKGAQVAISGECFLDEWEKDGIKNKMLKVIVNSLDLIGNNQGTSAPTQQPATTQEPQSHQQQMADLDQEIPFMNPYKGIENIV